MNAPGTPLISSQSNVMLNADSCYISTSDIFAIRETYNLIKTLPWMLLVSKKYGPLETWCAPTEAKLGFASRLI